MEKDFLMDNWYRIWKNHYSVLCFDWFQWHTRIEIILLPNTLAWSSFQNEPMEYEQLFGFVVAIVGWCSSASFSRKTIPTQAYILSGNQQSLQWLLPTLFIPWVPGSKHQTRDDQKAGSPCTSAEGEKHPTAALTALSPNFPPPWKQTVKQQASTAQLETSIHNSLFQRQYNHGRGHDEMDSVGRNRWHD